MKYVVDDVAGTSICEGNESDIVFLELDTQYKREQDLQVHNGSTFQLTVVT